MDKTTPLHTGITRRRLLTTAAALPLFAIGTSKANAAEFTYKLATGQDPKHPVNVRAQQAIDRIREATSGRLEIRLFPANQLGSDTDLLTQVRTGGVEFFNEASVVLSTLVPAAGIVNTGFAFSDYGQVWKAMDGSLGKYVRAQIEKAGLLTMSKAWDNGFRDVTTSSQPVHEPADLKGLKLRVPPAPMLLDLFKAIGSSPTPINFNELYSALQTHLVDGEENPLPIISTTHLYEVQKYCSLTKHVWDAYWILGNPAAVARLPKPIQDIVRREFDRAANEERADIQNLSNTLQKTLASKGLEMIEPDKPSFKKALVAAGFYRTLRGKFGEQAWSLLQDNVGALG